MQNRPGVNHQPLSMSDVESALIFTALDVEGSNTAALVITITNSSRVRELHAIVKSIFEMRPKQKKNAEAPMLRYSWVSATSVVVQCGCVWALGGAGHLINDASPS